jgi:hypothetical protein
MQRIRNTILKGAHHERMRQKGNDPKRPRPLSLPEHHCRRETVRAGGREDLPPPTKGKELMTERYRVQVNPALEYDPSAFFEFMAEDRSGAEQARNAMANLLLYLQDTLGVMGDFANIFWIEVSIDGGPWEEIGEEEEDD